MEGWQTHQAQGATASARWLQFAEWLRQQAGGPPEEAVSEASASDAEEASLLPEGPSAATPSSSTGASSQNGSSGNLAAVARAAGNGAPRVASPAPVSPGQLARHATLAPRLPDCRAEMRLTSDSSSRARQEMTVMLAAPGMPLHEAPVLTCKQASSLMAAICEPLLSLPVGRLTRKLAAPTKLQPTDDRGVLSLWLLPDDSLSLVWQSAQHLAPAAVDEMATAAVPSSSSSSGSSSGSDSGGGAPALPAVQQSCSVAVWEELAHFPAMAHLLDDAPVVTIHMLRGDASGRSFYIRVRSDVSEANLEAATAAVPDASRLLAQQQQQRAGISPATPGSTSGGSGASLAVQEPDSSGAPRMYFWLTNRDLGRAVYSLGRLKSLLKRPPTLAKRSGVPERQLAQLGAWVQRADLAAVAQQQREARQAGEQEEQEGSQAAWSERQGESGASPEAAAAPTSAAAAAEARHRAAAGSRARPVGLSPLLQAPGLLLGHTMAAAAQMQGGMAAALLPPLPGSSPGAAASSGGGGAGGEGEAVACGSSTVSATAAALYQDQRFNVVCPCTISVVVSMRMQAAASAAVDPALLPAEASARARAVAERQAKTAVDRSGRQRIEERLAEVVIRNVRAQRNRARKERQVQRDGAARQALARQALLLARQATGRTAEPSPPAQQQQEGAAATVPSTASAHMPHSSPFALAAASSGECELAAPANDHTTPPSFATPLASGGGGGRAFSSPAALPIPSPALPGSRVTLGNLHSLLNAPRLDTASSQSSATDELGGTAGSAAAAAGAAMANGRGSAAGAPSGALSIADLAELLGKHAKLD